MREWDRHEISQYMSLTSNSHARGLCISDKERSRGISSAYGLPQFKAVQSSSQRVSPLMDGGYGWR